VHDGSVGFFVQHTGGGVPVQLFTHGDPVLDPPDDGIDVLLGWNAADDVVVFTCGHVVLSLHVGGVGVARNRSKRRPRVTIITNQFVEATV
jgi:hypothetical protein